MYKPKHFTIKELVGDGLLSKINERTAWIIFDDRLLKCADLIREKYGPCFVNSGALVDCGLRDINSKTGAGYSAHKYGRALDLHIVAIENKAKNKDEKTKLYDDVRNELLKDSRFDVLNFEIGISWLHIDTFNRENRTFRP